MTRVSRLEASGSRTGTAKGRKRQVLVKLAQCLLTVAVMAALSSLVIAGAESCVVPPPLDVADPDAGPSAPPVIESAGGQGYALPGPIQLLDPSQAPEMSLTIQDVDSVSDPLYVRMFVDYGRTDLSGANQKPPQTPPLETCSIPPSGTITRTGSCPVAQLCSTITDTNNHLLEVMVADQPFLDENQRLKGQPPYQGLPPNAGYSFRSWLLQCNPQQP